MPAPISVVIPTLNAGTELPATTEALLPGLTDGLICELILSDGGSTDGTDLIAKELGAVWVTGPTGRGRQIAAGVRAASGDWVLILHADTHLEPGWERAALKHMQSFPAKAGWFRLAFRSTGIAPWLVAGGANLRSRFLGLPYGDQGLLISAALLDEIGGVPEVPLMEDVALARALRGRLRALDATARTSAARYKRDGWGRRILGNLWTLARYFAGADPAELAQAYEARRGSDKSD
ncbi:MAG: TIGR04283 family arsenosugar biosynthesis glycosyltransferase [Paracoccaceae bacterium]|nr:TIGR04283 family arsenosugar biosynthesis glycosyltransferase [Paracoccaceae bacterium]